MAGIDINTTSGGADLLPRDVSQEIWAEVQEQSAVMHLAQQTKIPAGGLAIPVVTGDAQAYWTDETDEITPSRSTMTTKMIQGYKLAVLEPFSNEFRTDLPGLYEELKRRLPGAITKKFDSTVFGSLAPGSNFDTLGGATAIALSPHATDVKKGTYAGLVAADQAIATGGGDISGWAIAPQMRGILLNQVDSLGRPLLGDSIATAGAVQTLLSQPAYRTKGAYLAGSPNRVGFAGDWSSARWGFVNDIQFAVTTDASITDGVTTLNTSGAGTVDVPNVINLFQRDMFALRITFRLGFRVRSLAHFAKLTDAVIS